MSKLVGLAVLALGSLYSGAVCADSPANRKRDAGEVFADPGLARLARAAAVGDVEEVRKLVKGGVSVNGTGRRKMTPLAWAVIEDRARGVEALLELGANPNAELEVPGFEGGYPLVLLGAKASTEVLQLLLRFGGDPNAREPIDASAADECPYRGDTLLILSLPSVEKLALLIKAGADINLRPERRADFTGGHTVTEIAAMDGAFAALDFLLDRGGRELDTVAYFLQHSWWPPQVEPRRVAMLRKLHERGARIYYWKVNPQTPAELLTPGEAPPRKSIYGARHVCGPVSP